MYRIIKDKKELSYPMEIKYMYDTLESVYGIKREDASKKLGIDLPEDSYEWTERIQKYQS